MKKTALALCAVLLALPAGADAAPRTPKKPRLFVTSLIAPSGRMLDPARPFTITGRIANRSRRTSRAFVAFTLRTTRARTGNAYRVGAQSAFRVRRRSARRFRVRAQLPAGFPVRGRPLYLTACVRRARLARPRCRT
ncbi:MAG TPA: hypothetical protein VGW10_07880, partial [Solirubrobacteraceae bacterium]|nr:hypothetical protein [Solirubrobacteraceae bacterium]